MADLGDEIGLAVIDGPLGAEIETGGAFRRRAGSCKDPGAAGSG